LEEVEKDIGRSKTASLTFLNERLGHLRLPELDRERLIKFGKERASGEPGPLRSVSILDTSRRFYLMPQPCTASSCQLNQSISLGSLLVDLDWSEKGDERNRRPMQDELDRIILALESNTRQQIPVRRVIRFTTATAMRQGEIARIE